MVIVFEGDKAEFSCSASGTLDAFLWTVNGVLTGIYLKGATVNTDLSFKTSTLEFTATSEFNNGIIECVAIIGLETVISNNSTLKVQGMQN